MHPFFLCCNCEHSFQGITAIHPRPGKTLVSRPAVLQALLKPSLVHITADSQGEAPFASWKLTAHRGNFCRTCSPGFSLTPSIEQTSVSSNAREQEHDAPGTTLGIGVPTMSKRYSSCLSGTYIPVRKQALI